MSVFSCFIHYPYSSATENVKQNNDFFASENLKELGMEIEVFENGVGIVG